MSDFETSDPNIKSARYDHMLYVDDETATVKDVWEINRAAGG